MEMSSASLIFWLKFLPSCRSHITKQLIGTCTGFLFVGEQHKQQSGNHPDVAEVFLSSVAPLDQSWESNKAALVLGFGLDL